MADRNMTAAVITALSSDHRFYHAISFDFATPLRYTNCYKDLTISANSYISSDHIIEYPDIKESLGIKSHGISIKMSGVAIANHALALTESYLNKEVVIYRVYLDANNAQIADPVEMYKGYVDSYETEENIEKGTSVITWKIASHLVDFDRVVGREMSDDVQQNLHSGDLGFEYVEIANNVDFWSAEAPLPPAQAPFTPSSLQPTEPVSVGKSPYYTRASKKKSDKKLPVLYGKVNTNGIPVFKKWAVIGGAAVFDVVYAIGEGECESLVEVMFPGRKTKASSSNVSSYLTTTFYSGTTTQAADATLVADHPEWTTAHQLKGVCYVYIRYTNKDKWGDSEPIPEFVIEGKKLYDPRDLTTTYQANNALAAYDYLTNTTYGRGLAAASLGNIDEAADWCDTTVTTHDGGAGTQARFEVNGIIDTSEDLKSNIETILNSFYCRLAYVNGIYNLIYETTSEASVYSLDEDNLYGTFKVKEKGKNYLLNKIKVAFNDRKSGDQSSFTEFRPRPILVESATYLSADNNLELSRYQELPLETDRYRARYHGQIQLKKSRENILVECACMRGLSNRTELGNIVDVTRTTQGFSAKKFRVTAMTLRANGSTSFDELEEYESAVMDRTTPVETTPVADTDYHDPYTVEAPTSLVLASGTTHLLKAGDGTIISRINGTFTGAIDPFTNRYRVEYKISTETNYTNSMILEGNSNNEFFISPVQDGVTYNVRIYGMNVFDLDSSALTGNHVVVGKTAAPTTPTTLASAALTNGNKLTWSAISDADYDHTDIYAFTSDTRASVTVVGTSSTNAFTHVTGVAMYYWIKHVDTTGNESAFNATAGVLGTPTAVAAGDLSGSLDFANVDGATKPADNADVTGSNTANDTSNVNGVAAATVQSDAADGATFIDSDAGNFAYEDQVTPANQATLTDTSLIPDTVGNTTHITRLNFDSIVPFSITNGDGSAYCDLGKLYVRADVTASDAVVRLKRPLGAVSAGTFHWSKDRTTKFIVAPISASSRSTSDLIRVGVGDITQLSGNKGYGVDFYMSGSTMYCRAFKIAGTAMATGTAFTVTPYNDYEIECVFLAGTSLTIYVNGVSRGVFTTSLPTSYQGANLPLHVRVDGHATYPAELRVSEFIDQLMES